MRSTVRTPLILGAILGALSPGFLSVAPPAAEALIRHLDLEALSKKSKYVVTAQVVDIQSYEAPFLDLGDVIFTDVKVRIERAIKGKPEGAELTIQVLGGQIGKVFQACPDSPRYTEGEKVLLFLRDRKGKLWNTGWFQGKYTLSPDGSTVRGSKLLAISQDTPLTQIEARVRAYVPELSVGNSGLEEGAAASGSPAYRPVRPASREASSGRSR